MQDGLNLDIDKLYDFLFVTSPTCRKYCQAELQEEQDILISPKHCDIIIFILLIIYFSTPETLMIYCCDLEQSTLSQLKFKEWFFSYESTTFREL